jgi:hypothetical protein
MPDLDASQFFKVIFFRQTSNAVAAEARSLQAVNLRGHLRVWLAGWLAGWRAGWLAGRQDVTTNNALETDEGRERLENEATQKKSLTCARVCVSWLSV